MTEHSMKEMQFVSFVISFSFVLLFDKLLKCKYHLGSFITCSISHVINPFSLIIASLKLGDNTLHWHRLDDGVMGGQSETLHTSTDAGELIFKGQINTNGGGFTSIRSPIEGGLASDTTAIRVSYIGDGKTYKVLLSEGNKSAFGPSRRSPSWQTDLPTKNDGSEETTIISFDSLVPSLQGGRIKTDAKLAPTEGDWIYAVVKAK